MSADSTNEDDEDGIRIHKIALFAFLFEKVPFVFGAQLSASPFPHPNPLFSS